MRALALLLVLAACAPGAPLRPAAAPSSPLVTARGGASTSLTIISCNLTPTGAQSTQDLIQSLAAQGELVTAESGGSARLVINSCPAGLSADMIRAAADYARAARAR